MLLTGHLRSLPARSLEDPKTNKKRLWDSLVNFSIKKCFHLGCLGSDSGSNGSQVVGLAAVAAAATQTEKVPEAVFLSPPRGMGTSPCVRLVALEPRVAGSSAGQCRASDTVTAECWLVPLYTEHLPIGSG